MAYLENLADRLGEGESMGGGRLTNGEALGNYGPVMGHKYNPATCRPHSANLGCGAGIMLSALAAMFGFGFVISMWLGRILVGAP